MANDIARVILAVLIGLMIGVFLILLGIFPARADLLDPWGQPCYEAPRKVHHATRHHSHKPRRTRPPEVRAYVKREDEDRLVCLDRVRVVGSQWATESGAEESARKAWMEQVRWRFGESAMSIEAAQDYSKRCSRSSIGEVANSVLHRCEVQARPCRPVFESKGSPAN